MILIYKCHRCFRTFPLNSKANDRGEFNRKCNQIEVCSYCKYKNEIDANRVKAKISPYNNFVYGIALLVDIIALALVLIFSNFVFVSRTSNFQYYALALGFSIPFLIAKISIQNDLKAVKNFNSYYV